MGGYEIRSIRVDPPEWRIASIAAAAEGISMSELIRRLVEEFNIERLKD